MKIIKTEFDATLNYGIESKIGLQGLIIESRGGTKQSNNYRNPEHSLLLAYVLKKMQNSEVQDLEIYVASNSISYKNIAERKILYKENFKIDFRTVNDFEAFLKNIKKSIKISGQSENSKGGNSTKKILLYSKSFNLKKLFDNSLDQLIIKKLNDQDLEYTLQKVKKRLRQSKFRKELLIAYDNTCAVTGSKVIPLLEAAHIQPYNGASSSIVTNGILLRSDIHDLFDIYEDENRLLNISSDYIVEVHASLKGSEYWEYSGKKINLPKNEKDYPDFKI